MNTTNKTFSFNRFMLLFKHEYILRKSQILATSAGTFFVIFGLQMFILFSEKFSTDINRFLVFLYFGTMTILGIVYAGTSFPAFRKEKKTLNYLLTPNSVFEKYIFEVLYRIILLFLLYPIIFWVAAQLSTSSFNLLVTENIEANYSIGEVIAEMLNKTNNLLKLSSSSSSIIFYISIPFVLGAFFSKFPILKIALSFVIFFAGTVGHALITNKILTAAQYKNNSIGTFLIFLTVFFILSTIILHTAAYYRLKEKEV